jgi:hypothetical protein
MKKFSKQRLFEMMEKLNPEFILNEDFVPRSVGTNMTRSVSTDMGLLDLHKKYTQSDNWKKPNGLWYQINSSWVNLCIKNNKDAESHGFEPHYAFEIKNYNIIINVDLTNVVILDTRDKVIEFSKKYDNGEFFIKWNDVAKDYKGIEIPNYKSVNYYKWMNGWDINSGCIWDLTTIKNYKVNDCEIYK